MRQSTVPFNAEKFDTTLTGNIEDQNQRMPYQEIPSIK
jgi:hypothetical protein